MSDPQPTITTPDAPRHDDAARAASLAYILAHATPLVDTRTPAQQAADDEVAAQHNRVADEHGLVSLWAVDGADDLSAPHPYLGATTVVHQTTTGETERGRHWGGDGGVWEVPILGPRWVDLWVAADAAIQASGDLHHRFVELFQPDLAHPERLHLFAGS